jgi:hypothetical protein
MYIYSGYAIMRRERIHTYMLHRICFNMMQGPLQNMIEENMFNSE